MKRRTVLAHQSAKRRRNRDPFPLGGVIRRLGSIFLRVSLLITLIAVISLSFLSLYQYLLASPYLKLEQVEVAGVDEDIRDELIERSGLSAETSLLALDLNKLKQELEKHPWVRAVRLERQLPHTLAVKAEQEKPCALVLMDKIYYMNPQGEVFKEVGDSEKMDFPLITGISRQGADMQEQLQNAALVISALESEQGRWSLKGLSEIHVKREGSISLYFTHLDAEIKLSCDDLRNKMDGLKKVTQHLNKTGRIHQVTGIDLNSEDGVVVSFRKG